MNTSKIINKSIFLVSLPRSGSSFTEAEIRSKTDLYNIREPLRRLVKDKGSAIFPSRIVTSFEVYKNALNASSNFRIRNLFDAVNTEKYLIKETDAIFQIEILSRLLPNCEFVAVNRDLLSIISSHLKFKDIWKNWNYKTRIESFLQSTSGISNERVRNYANILSHVTKMKFRGDSMYAQLIAYLYVQKCELDYLQNTGIVKYGVNYKDTLLTHGQNLTVLLSKLGYISRNIQRSQTNNIGSENGHHTKLSQAELKKKLVEIPENLSYSDILEISRIIPIEKSVITKNALRNHGSPSLQLLREHSINSTSKLKVLKEEFIGITFPDRKKFVLNRPVTNLQFVRFLNILSLYIATPHDKLLGGISGKDIIYIHELNKYKCAGNASRLPVTNVSILGAAAYSFYRGGRLLSDIDYAFMNSKMTGALGNVNENLNAKNISGCFTADQLGLYDLYGNIKELTYTDTDTDTDKDFNMASLYGLSYLNEHFEHNKIFIRVPLMYFDRDIGFRFHKYPRKKMSSLSVLVSILKTLDKSLTYDEYISNLRKVLRELISPQND